MRLGLATTLVWSLLLILGSSIGWAQDVPDAPPVEEDTSSKPALEGASLEAAEGTPAESPPEEAPVASPEEAAPPESAPAGKADEEAPGQGDPWRDDYKKMVDVYARMSQDYEGAVKEYIGGQVEGMISSADHTREEMVNKLRSVENKRRREAMATLESFLARYERYKSDPQYREHIADTLFKLGELYRDQAEYKMEMDSMLYDQRMKEYEWGIRPSPPNDADVDYTRAMEMYTRVVNEFKDYRYRDMVMYLLGYYRRTSEDPDGSVAVLKEMTASYPDSHYAMAAWMLLGHNCYDLSNYKDAIAAYSVVASRKENNESYEDALYRLGWASFEEFHYEQAIAAFLALLDYGQESMGKKKQRLALRKEAIESIANSFVDADWDGDSLADADYGPDRALRYLSRGVEYEKEIILVYANLLFDLRDAEHSRHAVVAYAEYLKRNPMDPQNPEVHDKLVYSYFELSRAMSVSETDRAYFGEQAMKERKSMALLYGKGSKWADMHKYDAKALELAASKLSANLLERAQLLHVKAQEVKEELDGEAARPYYERAAAAYKDFLDEFPESPQYVEMLARYCDVLMFGLNDFVASAGAYSILRDLDRKDNPYREEAASAVLEARAKLVEAAAAAADPNVPIPEKIFDMAEGTTIAKLGPLDQKDPTKFRTVTSVEIPQVVLDWVAEAEKYISMKFPGEKNHEFSGMLAYQIAKVYMRYGHFPTARERLLAVLDSYKTHPLLSVYCFTDIARTYRLENDLDNLEKISLRMKEEVKSEKETVDEILASIKDARLSARFQRAGALLQSAKEAQEAENDKEARDLYSKAAWELEKIVDENPTFDKADVALLEAARSFEQVKLFEKAAQLYKRLVDEERFAKSDHREAAVESLAENYEKFFNFSGAIKTYLGLTRDYPKSKYAKGALLKAAMLYENDQQFLKAAEVVDQFARKYPNDEIIGKLNYGQIALFEKGEDRKAARSAHLAFLKKYGKKEKHISQAMMSTIKLGRMAEEDGKIKAAQKRYKQVVKMFDSSGLEPGSSAAKLCAEAQFRLAETRFEEYASIRLLGRSKEQRRKMIKKKEKLTELEQVYGKIAGYESPDWIVAAIYKVGAMYKDLSESLANAPYPPDMPQDEDVKFQYEIQIGDFKAKLEDRARGLWRDGVEISKKTGVYSEWTTRILEELNKYEEDRERYPLYRDLKQYKSDVPVLHFQTGE